MDASLRRFAHHITLLLEDSVAFRDPMDRRINADLKRLYSLARPACRPAVALTSVAAALGLNLHLCVFGAFCGFALPSIYHDLTRSVVRVCGMQGALGVHGCESSLRVWVAELVDGCLDESLGSGSSSPLQFSRLL